MPRRYAEGAFDSRIQFQIILISCERQCWDVSHWKLMLPKFMRKLRMFSFVLLETDGNRRLRSFCISVGSILTTRNMNSHDEELIKALCDVLIAMVWFVGSRWLKCSIPNTRMNRPANEPLSEKKTRREMEMIPLTDRTCICVAFGWIPFLQPIASDNDASCGSKSKHKTMNKT